MGVQYTISDAARLFDLTPADLRNYISKGYLRACGTPSGPGRERVFDKICLYELGIVRELSERNIPLAFAARTVSREIEIARMASAMVLTGKGMPLSEAMNSVESKGYEGLTSEWTHRDLSNPTLWVFLAEDFGSETSRGWAGIELAVKNLIRSTYTPLLTSVNRGENAPTYDPPHEYSTFGRTLFYVFNLTAAQAKVDHLIATKLEK